tara:strand:- start:144 stop:971 length:828 start_codon:yes stop_codon:yes gene_type:complete
MDNHSKAFLKWAGGKRKLLPKLLPLIGSPDVFIEPFCGSGVVWLNVESEKYLINDLNTDLISLFKELKKDGQQFIDYAQQFFSPTSNSSEVFYEFRERFNSLDVGDSERSALFVYLNRHCFNGLCRYNKSGGFNVPYGKYKNPQFPTEAINLFAEKSKKADFISIDFKEVFDIANDISVDKNVTIYCDPPYIPLSETSSFTSYSPSSFGLVQQEQLATCVNNSRHKVVVSNSDTPRTRELYKNLNLQELIVSRTISAKASSRKKVSEIIAINKKA